MLIINRDPETWFLGVLTERQEEEARTVTSRGDPEGDVSYTEAPGNGVVDQGTPTGPSQCEWPRTG